MATNLLSCDHTDEDYIDMEVSSHKNLLYHTRNSPPHPREFEFQMFSSTSECDTIPSPADELFYKGKLLPLHLPPRLQLVEKLLQNSYSYDKKVDIFDEFFGTPLATNTNTTPTTNTPFESCNISPSESCQVSKELNPGEYFLEYSTESSDMNGDNPQKSWARKLKLIKQSSLGSKLKASRAYLKSLFSKSGCSDDYSAAFSRNKNQGSVSEARESVSNYVKVAKKTPSGQIQRDRYQMTTTTSRSFKKEKVAEKGVGCHRRSFSGAIKRFSATKFVSSSSGSPSSSISSNSSGSSESNVRTRSGSLTTEIESSIQSAIAHCKNSQQQLHSRKTLSDVGFCSLSASRIVCDDQERQELCRG
ncbi:hypothetical protein RJ639_034684 [Escallonia herrerae]|uniref:Membrane-associated kinase regulator 4 n=1 Tax=Escallonia herrerae TaxID=1293975 RepID=A0AA88WVH9_9ASTE|nr:hypothetical protein RJ639_012907 [Escallonia herrerae]KAK3034447.1 hypothetical protein RJ639_034684 [Escallonia herrerae]